MLARRVAEHLEDIDGQPIFWRSAPGDGAPVLYLHGVPTSSDDWLPFLERTGGLAPDLPGFGRSSKRADLDYSIPGYERFLERFLDHVGAERYSLVVHDWGAVGLALAQTAPERLERLVVMNVVPFLPGYRWHRTARAWRTPLLGELLMGATNRWVLWQLSREASATPGPLPREFVDGLWEHFDQGTQRAILRLYRSAPSDVLARAGERLGEITAPALVLWGDRDPYIPARFADETAAALGSATVRHVDDANHWPWLDRPDVVDIVAEFLTDSPAKTAG
ncbi:MAG TPA: alpha/beta hydrolase [Solirubrobacteraceae bacterium]|nr:alpha/beta hydrolase [Solirubrobacteraceae bacterium]